MQVINVVVKSQSLTQKKFIRPSLRLLKQSMLLMILGDKTQLKSQKKLSWIWKKRTQSVQPLAWFSLRQNTDCSMLATSLLQSTIFLIACNGIWKEMATVIRLLCIFILNKFANHFKDLSFKRQIGLFCAIHLEIDFKIVQNKRQFYQIISGVKYEEKVLA